jgi:FkbM family methyltransferase
MRSGAKMNLDLGDRPQAIAFLVREYSPQHTKYIAERVPPGGTLFDVGAHIGLMSFAVVARRPDITVHAFEPNPGNAAAWRGNQHLNDHASTQLTEVGLSDHDGQVGFGLPSDSSSGTLDDQGDLQVPVTTLDRYCAQQGIKRIDVLKIDVQGHEPAVLRGAAGLLDAGAIETVVCEVDIAPVEAIVEVLTGYGFRPRRIPEIGVRGFLGRVASKRPAGDLAFERG